MIERYVTRTQLAKLTGWKRERIRQFIQGLQESGRYQPEEIITDGHLILIHEQIVLDWLRYRKILQKGELVPPYRGGNP